MGVAQYNRGSRVIRKEFDDAQTAQAQREVSMGIPRLVSERMKEQRSIHASESKKSAARIAELERALAEKIAESRRLKEEIAASRAIASKMREIAEERDRKSKLSARALRDLASPDKLAKWQYEHEWERERDEASRIGRLDEFYAENERLRGAVQVGPRGGRYLITPSGKKWYVAGRE